MIDKIQGKREREKRTVALMIRLYCRKKHGTKKNLCPECEALSQSAIYDAFYQVMMPQYGANAKECYQARFYSYGLFGLLDEWIKRGFKESVEEMVIFFYQIIKN